MPSVQQQRPLIEHAPLTSTTQSRACLNCSALLEGSFCATCGQRDIPPYPSLRELVTEAFEELSGWDGRFVSSFRAIVLRPGMLTREFLEGRRARYLSPLRLYLVASLVYFLLAAGAPNVRLQSGETLFMGLRVGTSTAQSPSRAESVVNQARTSLESQQAITAAEREEALKDIARAPKVVQPFLRKAVEDPAGFRRGVLQAMPRMLFVLLPVFAVIVSLFYRRRKYPEHFYFAIHLHTFIFLALSAAVALRYTQSVKLGFLSGLAVALWVPTYATLAFRRVYGGSVVGTLAKELVICLLYCVVSGIALVGTIYWVSVMS